MMVIFFVGIGLSMISVGFCSSPLQLGAALLAKPKPMYVRTGVLATNLGVHIKHGRDSSAVWVTTLDKAQPVEGAEVQISECHGKLLWQGKTNAQGIATGIERSLVAHIGDHRVGAVRTTASRDGDLEIYTMDVEGKNVRRLTHEPGYDGGPFFSPDGKYLATSQSLETWAIRMVLSKHRVRLWEVASGKEVAAWNDLRSAPALLEFSPDGRRLTFATGEALNIGANTLGPGLKRFERR